MQKATRIAYNEQLIDAGGDMLGLECVNIRKRLRIYDKEV